MISEVSGSEHGVLLQDSGRLLLVRQMFVESLPCQQPWWFPEDAVTKHCQRVTQSSRTLWSSRCASCVSEVQVTAGACFQNLSWPQAPPGVPQGPWLQRFRLCICWHLGAPVTSEYRPCGLI